MLLNLVAGLCVPPPPPVHSEDVVVVSVVRRVAAAPAINTRERMPSLPADAGVVQVTETGTENCRIKRRLNYDRNICN